MIKIEEEAISTKEEFQIIDITDKIENYIKKNKIKKGIAVITTKHTTTAIRINENEPLLIKDISNFLNELVSKDKDYFHDDISKRKNCPEDEPKNAHAHLKALLMGASETIPIKDGKLSLGKWQRIFFIELDGPRERVFSSTFIAG
jgi:secondary thiamine-phosphate synthase enzyme